ncbi:hypothetical protein KQX54_002843 [Cotesia glomerata]|uniref:Uncharacterized protein n=1 Tax=Cotesia glomerata TaxID=32391 RepID=A0AAV7IIQ5_COTGL|nr:hypothetical protein KQX54_002843 [Cotesia glomerata]
MGVVVAKVAEESPGNESLRIIAFKIRLRHLCLSAGGGAGEPSKNRGVMYDVVRVTCEKLTEECQDTIGIGITIAIAITITVARIECNDL